MNKFLKYEAEHSAKYHCPASGILEFIQWTYYSFRKWKYGN